MSNFRQRAVVLGAGGIVGTAWMAGLAAGMRRYDVDLTAADLIIGTSAGAIIGTMLATKQDLDQLAYPPRPTITDKAEFVDIEQEQLARMSSLINAREWPDRPLLINAVDAETGQRKVWDRLSGVALLSAVASSIAFPGAFPPITIDGRRYIDGGLWSGTNADLAVHASVLVIVEPLAHLFPRTPLEQEIASTDAGTVVMINPDPATIDAFGPDLHDRAAWHSSYQAGVRQAAEAAERLHAAWSD